MDVLHDTFCVLPPFGLNPFVVGQIKILPNWFLLQWLVLCWWWRPRSSTNVKTRRVVWDLQLWWRQDDWGALRVVQCPGEEHGVLGEASISGYLREKWLNLRSRRLWNFGSSQGDKTGYSSHNQGAEAEAFILKLFLPIFYLRKEIPRE